MTAVPPFAYHPSLKKTFKGCQQWLTYESSRGVPTKCSTILQEWLQVPERPARMRGDPLHDLGHYYGIAACDAYRRQDMQELARFLRWAVAWRALNLRYRSMFSARRPDLGNWPSEFRDSMKAVGPLMLSQWGEARNCAERFMQMAEKDEQVNQPPATRRVNHNTNDVFLMGLFAQAFARPTDFQPRLPLIEPYQQLLDVWQSDDEVRFQAGMQAAAEFHISRSKDSTGHKFYEFNYDIDRVFPGELLAVQALRQRDGLPSFTAGHLLVDGPWQLIQQLPETAPHPLARAVEAQLFKDYADFQ